MNKTETSFNVRTALIEKPNTWVATIEFRGRKLAIGFDMNRMKLATSSLSIAKDILPSDCSSDLGTYVPTEKDLDNAIELTIGGDEK